MAIKSLPMVRITFIFLLVGFGYQPSSASNPIYKQLVNDLFSDYVKEIRPARDASLPTKARLTLSLRAIEDLEERNQILVSSVVIHIKYNDGYLQWNASDYGGINALIYPQEKVWLPDLVVENSVEKLARLGYDDMTVLIGSTGSVEWRPSEVLRTSCDVDVTYYPFDTQTCSITLATWTSHSKDILLQIGDVAEVNLDQYSQSGAWELVKTEVEDLTGKDTFTRISFHLTMKRRRTYYVLNMIIPVIALCATASLVFALPAEAGEKIGMSITVLLAYAVYLTIISESMPRTSMQVSIMGVYLSVLLTCTSLAVVFTVLVLLVYHKDEELPIGNRLRRSVIKIRPLIGLHDLRKGLQLFTRSGSDLSAVTTTSDMTSLTSLSTTKGTRPTRRQVGPVTTIMNDNLFINAEKDKKVDTLHENHETKRGYSSSTGSDDVSMARTTPNVSWKHVSETLDRLLFILFTSFTGLSSVVFILLLSFGSP